MSLWLVVVSQRIGPAGGPWRTEAAGVAWASM